MSESKEKQAASKTSASSKTTPVGSTTVTASASQPITDSGDSKGTLNKTSSLAMGNIGSGTKRKSKTGAAPSSSKGMKTLKSAKSLGTNRSMSRMKVRKQSYGFSGVSGIRLMSRSSMGNVEYKRPPLLFFPTYQLDSLQPFNAPLTLKIMQEVIDEAFLDHRYNVQESPALAMKISHEVMRRVKALSFNRYRIFAVTTIGQKRAQSYYNAVSFLWDPERDNYVNTQAEVPTAFLQVTVFAIYLD